ncbi:hypothetical protein DCAR_0101733 [Daucus carota subsp. sativus]|uniref:PB1 domain-containing protein n=1 Tax=Daucus carota subsp. sativus TaxID=79200 RepID=A0AAF0W6M1_DAUCS|nr:hypothetical protein DCAR_0101733 [Daucus carota subsp. sativus]
MEDNTITEDSECVAEIEQRVPRNSLIQVWKRSLTTSGVGFYELKIDPNYPSKITGCNEQGDREQLLRYTTQSAVFKKNRAEISPNISYYSADEYPQRDFALSCGIRTSFCFPWYNTFGCLGLPEGVVEFVSSLDQDLETITCYCRSLESQAFAIPEIDHLLERVFQTFKVPVAQYWIYSDLSETFRVVHQFSSREFENLASWWEFKDVCLHMPLKKYEGLVGTRYFSHESCFFRDITELSIDDYPFKHYAQKCGSIASFTIRLHSPYPPSKAYVLEFLFPSQGNDSYHPQTLLNSLLVEMKEHLPNFMLTSGEQLVHVSSVKVINISTLENPKSFDIGQPDSSLPRHEGLLYTHTMKLFKDGTEQSSNLTSYEEAATGETSKRTPSEVPEIVHFSRSTFKRLCRDYGIKRWQNRKRRMDGDVSSKLTTKLKNEEPSIRNFSYSGTTPVQDTIVARTGQELNEMTVKVTYNGINIRFKLPGSSGMAELENNVIERLHLERKSFSIKYQDDEEDWVLIACDRDVWECMQLARSLKKSTIKLLLDLPIHHHAP